jgi:hypothetical protein
MGVETEALAALGKVVVGAGRVEMVLAMVANEIGVLEPSAGVSRVIKELRKASQMDLPAPIAAVCVDVLEWASGLGEPFKFRNNILHGAHMQSLNAENGFDPIALQLRSGERQPVSVDELEAVAERLACLHTEGMALFGAAHIANLSLKPQSHRR